MHRYNDLGLVGLSDRVPPGAKPRLSPEQEAELAALVRAGPQIDQHGVVRWRGINLSQGARLNVLDNISLLLLPPYSPELNPQENIWQYLRQNHLANRVFETYETIVDALCAAWNSLTAQPDRITSIAAREWASQVKV